MFSMFFCNDAAYQFQVCPKCVMSPKKNFFFLAHSLTMVLSLFLLHRAALEYRENFFDYDFVTVGKNFEYKFSKMLSDVCFDLSLLWHLPNQDIAFEIIKQSKYNFVTVGKKKLNTNFQKCSQIFVLICHCHGNCLIRILHLK